MSKASELSSLANYWIMTIICVFISGNIAKFMRKTNPATEKLPVHKRSFAYVHAEIYSEDFILLALPQAKRSLSTAETPFP